MPFQNALFPARGGGSGGSRDGLEPLRHTEAVSLRSIAFHSVLLHLTTHVRNRAVFKNGSETTQGSVCDGPRTAKNAVDRNENPESYGFSSKRRQMPPRYGFARLHFIASRHFSSKNGGGRWIRTTESGASRFTVCPL